MSLESLLLLLFFLVLPLIEMFRTAAKSRQEQRQPEPPRKQPVPAREAPRTTQTQLPPELTGVSHVPELTVPQNLAVPPSADPSVLKALERISDQTAARRRTTRRQSPANSLPHTAPLTERRMIHGVIRGLRRPGGVHRAVVAMTILGPCRAVDPHSWRESNRLN